jgi:hypothetical protein
LSVTGGILAGVGLAGAGISAGTSLTAAGEQSSAANNAANLQAQEAQNALDFQKQEWTTTQANEAPWLSAGKGALSNLSAILAEPGQGWNETFQAPTAEEAANYPGYQFQEKQGEEALQNSAASKGALYSGNTQEALARYGQQSAQSDYTNVYNQAFQQYQQRYGQHNDILNRLAALSGIGQNTATTLGQQGQAAASNAGNIFLTTGAQQGQDIQNAAAAEASGYVGAGNAFSGAFGNLGNLYMLQQLFGQGGITGGVPGGPGIIPTDAQIINPGVGAP